MSGLDPEKDFLYFLKLRFMIFQKNLEVADWQFADAHVAKLHHLTFHFQAYLMFVIFFTRAKFLENKIYTEKRQFFALNL